MGQERFKLALTGNTWAIVRDSFPELLPRICTRGAVFARMSSEQKQQLVQELQALGYYVGKFSTLSVVKPCMRQRGEEIYLLLCFYLGTTWGEWSASSPGRALPPGERTPPVPTGQEAGWAPEPVWTQRLEKESFASDRDGTPVVQSAVRQYNDGAIAVNNAAQATDY
jgi:hypothetical protein